MFLSLLLNVKEININDMLCMWNLCQCQHEVIEMSCNVFDIDFSLKRVIIALHLILGTFLACWKENEPSTSFSWQVRQLCHILRVFVLLLLFFSDFDQSNLYWISMMDGRTDQHTANIIFLFCFCCFFFMIHWFQVISLPNKSLFTSLTRFW